MEAADEGNTRKSVLVSSRFATAPTRLVTVFFDDRLYSVRYELCIATDCSRSDCVVTMINRPYFAHNFPFIPPSIIPMPPLPSHEPFYIRTPT